MLCILFVRAVLIGSDETNGTSTVLFVDYGNTEHVTNSHLKVLPPSLCTQPPIALECTCQQQAVHDMGTDQLAQVVNGKELTLSINGDTQPFDLCIMDLQQGMCFNVVIS